MLNGDGGATASKSTLRDELRPRGPVNFVLVRSETRDATVLALTGELDLLTAPRFGTDIGEVVRSGTKDVIVDLRGLSFVDSTGLHVLLNAQRRLTRQRRRLVVRCGAGPVRRAIELSRLAETFGLEPLATEQPEPDRS